MDVQSQKIETALSLLGISIADTETTDPKVMSEILQEMNLDFGNLPLLTRLLTEPIPLKPLKEMIILGIQQNPPLHQTLLEISEIHGSSNALSSKQKEQLKYYIYISVILETLTYLIVNNKGIEQILVPRIFKSRNSVNYGSSFWSFMNKLVESKKIFLAIKSMSVDPFIFEDLCFRQYPPCPKDEEIKLFIKQHHLTGLNSRILKKSSQCHENGQLNYGWLYGNILEAVTQEELLAGKKSKSKDNIKAGLALLYRLDNPQGSSPFSYKKSEFDFKALCKSASVSESSFWNEVYARKDPNNFIKSSTLCTEEFINAYEAWNLGFMVIMFPKSFYLYLPKLLMPSTLACVPEYYFASRAVSLWLTIHFMSGLRKGKNRIINYSIPNMEAFLTILGRNNLQYSRETLLKNAVNLDQRYKDTVHRQWFGKNYIKAIRSILS